MEHKKLRKSYIPLIPKLNSALKHVKSQFSDLPHSDFQFEANFKPYASVKRKMEDEKINDPADLSDLVRGRLFFSPKFEHSEVINIANHLFGDKIIKIDENPQKSKEHGLEYHGITHINMDINGVHFELQIMPIAFHKYKDLLHKIYEHLRDPKMSEKLSDKQRDFLRKTHNNIYKNLDKKSKSSK
jgi:hypothetical protein